MKPAKLEFQLGRGPLKFLKSVKGSLGSKRLGTTGVNSQLIEIMNGLDFGMNSGFHYYFSYVHLVSFETWAFAIIIKFWQNDVFVINSLDSGGWHSLF